MKHLIFTCPKTKEKVQHRYDTAHDDYESVECLSCTGVHFVNLKTGKVLGQN